MTNLMKSARRTMSESKESFQFPMQEGSVCPKTKVIQANFTMGGGVQKRVANAFLVFLSRN